MLTLPAGTDSKAIHKLLDEIRDLNKTIKRSNIISERLTWLLVIVGVLQLALMSFQLAGFEHMWVGIGFEVIVMVALLIMFWFVLKRQ